jgi:hypothetical protein
VFFEYQFFYWSQPDSYMSHACRTENIEFTYSVYE